MSEYIALEPMPVHAILCLCGYVITFPTSWEYVSCPGCKLGWHKNNNGNYVKEQS
jgi:hypothetical protein